MRIPDTRKALSASLVMALAIAGAAFGLVPAAIAFAGGVLAVVVLGARSNAGRFWETRHLFNWLSSQSQAVLTAQGQQQ